MAFLAGAVIAMFLISSLVGFLVFRKTDKPKKHLFSVPIAWGIATVIAGYGEGGTSPFLTAAINYGIASIILLAIYLSSDFLLGKLKKNSK
jgi:O-antigen/teichoic acid export membrane protein